MTEKFDFEQALEALKAGKPITGKDRVLSPLIKQLTEAALEAEIDTHLAQEVNANRKMQTYLNQNSMRVTGRLFRCNAVCYSPVP